MSEFFLGISTECHAVKLKENHLLGCGNKPQTLQDARGRSRKKGIVRHLAAQG
jgi:hypothetical protein